MPADNSARNTFFLRLQTLSPSARAQKQTTHAVYLSALLDKMIGGLMAAIVLTLACPVGMTLQAQAQPSSASVCLQTQHGGPRITNRVRHVQNT